MPDMNENSETQQEWLRMTKGKVLNGGRGSGQSFRALVVYYENRITELENKLGQIRNYLAFDIPHELINEATNKIWKML